MPRSWLPTRRAIGAGRVPAFVLAPVAADIGGPSANHRRTIMAEGPGA
jgi:hypothetical protein